MSVGKTMASKERFKVLSILLGERTEEDKELGII